MKETLRQLPALSSEVQGHVPVQGTKSTSFGAMSLFVVGSFLAHGVAYAALSVLPSELPAAPVTTELAFEVLAPLPEPAPEPVVEAPPPPEPKAIVAPKRVAVKAVEKPVPVENPVPEAAPALQQTLGVSEEKGLAVAGVVGAPTPLAGTSLTGSPDGVIGGTGPAKPTATISKIDLQSIARKWQEQVQAVINARARRDYPRSAMRAHLEGLVLLSIRIDPFGRIAEVELKKSSGHPQLDEAALASAKQLGELPAPPSALHSYLRPMPFPINYRLQ